MGGSIKDGATPSAGRAHNGDDAAAAAIRLRDETHVAVESLRAACLALSPLAAAPLRVGARHQ